MAVDRDYILDKMKGRIMTVDEFDYDRLWAPPLFSLITYDDADQLNRLATSLKYSGKPVEKMDAIDKIMRRRGFRKFGGGTNRVVYKFLEDDRFVLKIATCKVAIDDSPREFINQEDLKPFCAKCFEVSPCGTVGLFERVLPITSREEFFSIADQAYDLITNILTGAYVMDDIGTEYFMNYGVRKGFGCVLLDYVYRYKLDGNKLYCNNTYPDGTHCGGVIDYDAGFNRLRCTKCGREYKAIELKQAIDNSMVIKEGGKSKMKVALKQGDTVVYQDTEPYEDTSTKLVGRKNGKKSKVGHLKIKLSTSKEIITPEEEDEPKHTLRGMIPHTPSKEEEVVDEDEEEYWDDEGNLYSENKLEAFDSLADDYPDQDMSYAVCYADIGKASEFTKDDSDDFKVLYFTDDDDNLLTDDYGYPYICGNIMDKSLEDIVILDKQAYQDLLNKIDDLEKQLSAENENTHYEESDAPTPKEDDKLPYYIDDNGDKRWKSNHNLYKKEDAPVGAAPPQKSKENERMEEAFEKQLNDDGRPAKKSKKK